MIDINVIKKDFIGTRNKMRTRGIKLFDTPRFKNLDHERRSTQEQLEKLRARRNFFSKKIGEAKKKQKENPEVDLTQHIENLMEKVKGSNAQMNKLSIYLRMKEHEAMIELASVPNFPHDSVPIGKTSEDNVVIRTIGDPRAFVGWEPKSHVELGKELNILDVKTGTQLSGSGFPLLRGMGAKLERALINYMLDIHTSNHGYEEISPPYIVKEDTMYGTSQLPKFRDDLYHIEKDNLYLIPTGEVPLTNMIGDNILKESDLPIKMVSHTPCFRREAGSAGKDKKGLSRVHQFHKVELVRIVKPEESYSHLEEMVLNAEFILKELKIPYRVIELCTGDLGFSAAKTYDIEVWLPYSKQYREISSCSNTEDFQARRMKTRMRRDGVKKTELVHTLNASGLAVGRLLIAILETYQMPDGTIQIPNVLLPYMGNISHIK